MSNENKDFEGDAARTSSFRHRGDDSVLRNNVNGKNPSYFYNEGDYFIANQGRNRISNDGGEQEEMLAPDFQGDFVFYHIVPYPVGHLEQFNAYVMSVLFLVN
jgi:hypothetical protein